MGRLRVAFVVVALLLALFAVSGEAADLKDSEWQNIEADGITIFYHPDQEQVARYLLPGIVKRLKSSPLGQGQEQIDAVAKHRDDILSFIAKQLGMNEPGKTMEQVIDTQIASAPQEIAIEQNLRRFRLYDTGVLVNDLSSGQKVKGFNYDPATQKLSVPMLSVSTRIMLEQAEGTTRLSKVEVTGPEDVPLLISERSPAKAASQALAQVNQLEMFERDAAVRSGTALHEVVESGIVNDLGLRSPFRRWFTEGVANYIAAECIKKYVGEKISRQWLANCRRYCTNAMKRRISPLSWPSGEWEIDSPCQPDTDATNALYSFSTAEICRLVDRHGAGVIPAILAKIAEHQDMDDDAIFAAIREVTKEDLKSRLNGYGAKMPKDKLRTLALNNLYVVPFVMGSSGETTVGKPGEVIFMNADGKHGACLHFDYATLNLPIEAEVEVAPAGTIAVGTQVLRSKLERKQGALEFNLKFPDQLSRPGTYTARLYFEGKLWRSVNFTIAPGKNSSGL